MPMIPPLGASPDLIFRTEGHAMFPEKEPPLLMLSCHINPEWEAWLKRNYPELPDRDVNAVVFTRMLRMRASLDFLIKSMWDDYSEEALELIRNSPELWELLMSINPPKPTLFQRVVNRFRRGK